MIEIAAAFFGFAAPFLPEIMKYFNRKQDNTHELSVLKMQIEKGNQEHLWKMEEINTQGDISEAVELHKPQSSFGVQLLDAAKGQGLSGWALYPAFYMFCALDFISGLVRPGITYAAFAFYVSVKFAELQIAKAGSSTLSVAILQVWTSEDRAIVILVLSYWFGNRSAKAAFGGSAMNSSKGQ